MFQILKKLQNSVWDIKLNRILTCLNKRKNKQMNLIWTNCLGWKFKNFRLPEFKKTYKNSENCTNSWQYRTKRMMLTIKVWVRSVAQKLTSYITKQLSCNSIECASYLYCTIYWLQSTINSNSWALCYCSELAAEYLPENQFQIAFQNYRRHPCLIYNMYISKFQKYLTCCNKKILCAQHIWNYWIITKNRKFEKIVFHLLFSHFSSNTDIKDINYMIHKYEVL